MMTSLLRVAAFAAVGLSLVGLASAATYAKQDRATLRALDKITGRSTDIVVKVGEPVVYGSLSIELKTCFQTPPEEVPESAAFLRISSMMPVADEIQTVNAAGATAETPVVFSGWMYASSPGLSALEHPVYDIWVIRCTAPAPVKLPDRVIVPLGDEPLVDDIPAGVSETDVAPVIEEAPSDPID
ncbi:MAG: DUF2155 domain-containing protein [Hyphomonas sp.]